MLDILKSDLPLEYQNFWYNMGVKVQKHINGVVQVLFDTNTHIIIKVFIEKFNYGIYFSFPYRLTDKERILQHILNEIELKVYEEVFKN